MSLADFLASLARLRAAKRATASTPAAGDFAATACDLAARADVPPPVTTWSLDVVRS